jgi:hypothetical protein
MPKEPIDPHQPAEPNQHPVEEPQPNKDPIEPPPRDPQDDRPLRDPVPPEGDRPRSASKALLDKSVQDHLGQKLRAAYNEVAEKPKYLGDPALPPGMEDQLLQMETRFRTHAEGVEAVKDAFADLAPAHIQGVEAVRTALASSDTGQETGAPNDQPRASSYPN